MAPSRDPDRLSFVARATFLESFAHLIGYEDIVKRATEEDSPAAFRGRLRDGGTAWLASVAATGTPVGFALLTRPELPEVRTHGLDLELKR
ncbi:MAG: GNAT family N-acetyltransferase, partial [Litorimonas sp.]